MARSISRSYEEALTRLVRELGGDRSLPTLTVEAVTVAVTGARGGRDADDPEPPCATIRSLLGVCHRRRWLAEDLTADRESQPEPADRTTATPMAEP